MDCPYEPAGDRFRCPRCGDVRAKLVRRNCPRGGEVLGVGDLVYRTLDYLGVHAVLRRAGIKRCGCAGRREKLNRLLPLGKGAPDAQVAD